MKIHNEPHQRAWQIKPRNSWEHYGYSIVVAGLVMFAAAQGLRWWWLQ